MEIEPTRAECVRKVRPDVPLTSDHAEWELDEFLGRAYSGGASEVI